MQSETRQAYQLLRRIVGVLGIMLPIVLMVWGFFLSHSLTIQSSISDYYGLRARDALVGTLFVIAWFLFAYRPYHLDRIAGIVAWACALGVAFFPNSAYGWQARVHFISATGLFLTLAFFSLFLFTKTYGSPQTWRGTITNTPWGRVKSDDARFRNKKRRNRVYVACGLIMVGCMALVALYYWLWQDTAVSSLKPVFWLESIMIWAFGASWLVKSQPFWRDPDEQKQD
jgi:hypothetical protein